MATSRLEPSILQETKFGQHSGQLLLLVSGALSSTLLNTLEGMEVWESICAMTNLLIKNGTATSNTI